MSSVLRWARFVSLIFSFLGASLGAEDFSSAGPVSSSAGYPSHFRCAQIHFPAVFAGSAVRPYFFGYLVFL
jgi:hypothetical protein